MKTYSNRFCVNLNSIMCLVLLFFFFFNILITILLLFIAIVEIEFIYITHETVDTIKINNLDKTKELTFNNTYIG